MTHREIIEFYMKTNDYYKYTDLLKKENKNSSYVKLFNTFVVKGNKGKIEDKTFYKLLDENYDEMTCDKKLKWLNNEVDKDWVLCKNINTEDKLSQKWHLLISYYAFKIVKAYLIENEMCDECLNMKKITELSCLSKNADLFSIGINGLRCPELCLWMLESAKDLDEQETITSEEIEEIYNQFSKCVMTTNDLKKYEWWKEHHEIYWDKIVKIIKSKK